MKNIHVIPTDKPSRLLLSKRNNLQFLKDNASLNSNNHFEGTYQNIYITSNKEIKEGDWCLSTNKNFVIKMVNLPAFACDKKIILTTDQDLIKDGVQAIDDEFLEWFVKNPSCEYIEIENVYDKFLNGDKRSVSDFRKKYKINIPKEELKQCDICNMYPRLEGTNKCESCYSVVRHFLEQDPRFKDTLLPDLRKKQETSSVGAENQIFKIVLDEKWISNKVSIIEADNNSVLNKQETLEEAAQKFYPPTTTDFICSPKLVRDGFIAGVKWQQERSYSEEEVIRILIKAYEDIGKRKIPNQVVLAKWFEQFKKK